MTIAEAAEILRIHNEWRRGTDERTMDELPFTTAQLGEAIDLAVEVLSSDVLAEYTGNPPHRDWWSGGAWLYPGDAVMIVRLPKPPG